LKCMCILSDCQTCTHKYPSPEKRPLRGLSTTLRLAENNTSPPADFGSTSWKFLTDMWGRRASLPNLRDPANRRHMRVIDLSTMLDEWVRAEYLAETNANQRSKCPCRCKEQRVSQRISDRRRQEQAAQAGLLQGSPCALQCGAAAFLRLASLPQHKAGD